MTFLSRVPFYGAAIVCLDDPNVREFVDAETKQVRIDRGSGVSQ